MPCYLLHTIEQPDEDPYADDDVKDVVGVLPRFFCAQCDPVLRLRPGEAVKCLELMSPCWKAPGSGTPG